jgi:hypothetical protein
MNSKTYDRLKQVAQIWLPGLGTLYFTMANLWNLPASEEIVGSIVAIDAFLGLVLHISTQGYNAIGQYDGTCHVMTSEDGTKKTFQLVMNDDPSGEGFENKPSISFKISNQAPNEGVAG